MVRIFTCPHLSQQRTKKKKGANTGWWKQRGESVYSKLIKLLNSTPELFQTVFPLRQGKNLSPSLFVLFLLSKLWKTDPVSKTLMHKATLCLLLEKMLTEYTEKESLKHNGLFPPSPKRTVCFGLQGARKHVTSLCHVRSPRFFFLRCFTTQQNKMA